MFPRDISNISEIFTRCLVLLAFSIYVIYKVAPISLNRTVLHYKSQKWNKKTSRSLKINSAILYQSTFFFFLGSAINDHFIYFILFFVVVGSSLLLKVLAQIVFLYVKLFFKFSHHCSWHFHKQVEILEVKIGTKLPWFSMVKHI